tara:strand:- start:444 stop:815 length:372 start_codon:yes stop_codon:yes gene_type:complete
MADRARDNKKIEWKLNRVVKEWVGEQGNFEGAILQNTVSGEEELLKCDGAFIAIGHKPMTNFLENQIELDNHGYIIPRENTMTNVPGIFAAGDVVDSRYRQAITAAGMGCMAAIDAEKWLDEN